VTNVSLILGVVGAEATADVVRIAGLASLVAGACSMAVGEYVSMRAQVELLERLVGDEREAMRAAPERMRRILRDALERHGFERRTAAEATRELEARPEQAVGVFSRAVLGINPDELGSPWTAAASSCVTFGLGALLPLLPWFVSSGPRAALLSLVLAGGGALLIGGILGYLTGRRIVRSAVRQLFVITLAASVTFAVGKLFGTAAR